MCFYVYAPEKRISLEYVSESITLLGNGSSEVVIDLLVSNRSADPLDCLFILYPNKFVAVRSLGSEPSEIGLYEDVTWTSRAVPTSIIASTITQDAL